MQDITYVFVQKIVDSLNEKYHDDYAAKMEAITQMKHGLDGSDINDALVLAHIHAAKLQIEVEAQADE